MTDSYYVARKAEDLKVGNLFCHWAVSGNGQYPKPSRIDYIGEGLFGVSILLADKRKLDLRPEMVVVVQEVA